MKINKRAVIVLGMHRSGTSVLTKGLQALGVAIGDKLLDGNEWNAKGYFEHADVVDLNDELLALAGKRWDSLALPAAAELAPLFEPYKARAVALLERDFGAAPMCGIKDPRASRLLPFWRSVFESAGLQDCYIVALRNPISVARSLAARNGFKPEKSYLLWLLHMFAAIRDTQGKPRIVVDYDALIADPGAQIGRIATALDIALDAGTSQAVAEYASGFLSSTLRHSVHDALAVRDDPRIGELVGQAYDLLCRLARDEIAAPEAQRAFDRAWGALETSLQDIASIFRYLDVCEDRIDALTLHTESATSAPLELRTASAPARLPAASGAPAVPSAARISVVIPLYNHAQYIEATIASVLAQTLRPAEIIVVDDGSTDDSAAKVRQLCKQHPEIIFWSWPNQGAHHTLNAAIHRASGEFVAILNSDDRYEPDRLAACLAVVESNPALDAVATGVSFIDDQGQGIRSAWYEEVRAFYQEQGDLSLGLFHANFLLTTSNLFLRRAVFESAGYFSALRYTHDLEFFLRLILAKKQIHFLDRPLLAYRFHAQNTIAESQARVDVELAAIFAFFLYRQRLEDGGEGVWRAWLERYVGILGQKNILELVEYFLALLGGKQQAGAMAAADSLAAEFRQLLYRLGVDWVGQGIGAPLLKQFVAARNDFLRRWERASGDSKVIAAFTEQEKTIAALREDFTRQEQNIEQLRLHLAAAAQVVEEKNVELQRFDGEQHRLNGELHRLNGELHRVHTVLAEKDQALHTQADEIHRHLANAAALNDALIAKERELSVIRQGNWHKLGEALRQDGLSLKKLARIAYYFAACITPRSLKPAFQPLAARLKRRYQQQANPASNIAPQAVKAHPQQYPQQQPHGPRVLHVIANFMLGGSSRLVVDLIEALGDKYEHKVVTSYLPVPPAYVGIDVAEFRSPQSPQDVLAFLRDYDPDIVHVHYWGETDWWWYDIFFRAVQTLGCRVIENVNTPVAPYQADFVDRYVHVSGYVQQTFGDGSARNMTIYPGSDFGLFARPANLPLPRDCIGMVYRLETDKLNPQSIDAFIKVAQRRPQTRVIIVGGGTYLEPYRQAAQAARVADNFEFTGYVEYAKLPALYERMSLFVAPVWKESFGQVSPFAMNFGIPVVGYQVGGLAEIVNDAALLTAPGDSDALADLVIRLLDDPARCEEIGARNHARAQALFSVGAMTTAYRELYAELIGMQK